MVATAIWYGYSGTPPPPPVVLEVELGEVAEDEVELGEVVEDEVELLVVEVLVVGVLVVELVVDVLVVDVETVVAEEAEYCRTLESTPSTTQRLPPESKARPVGWSSPVGVGLIG